MNEAHMYGPKPVYLQLDNAMEFRISKTKEIEDLFISGVSERKKIIRLPNECITRPK